MEALFYTDDARRRPYTVHRTIETFQSLIRILANQGWVRYYLHMLPGRMVLELALPRGAPAPDRLRQDLCNRGFTALLCPEKIEGLQIFRWAIARTDSTSTV